MRPPTEEWIKKLWNIYYSLGKKKQNNDIIKFAGKWMILEKKIILGAVTQT